LNNDYQHIQSSPAKTVISLLRNQVVSLIGFCTKYRDALTYDEFKEICNQKFNEEAFINFDTVWHLEKKYANKVWTSDSYNEDGQTYHSGRYSKWVTH
jgi:hypothetical protein